MNRIALRGAVIAVVLVLTGCAAAPQADEPVTPPPSPSATPTPTSAVPSEDPGLPATWIVDSDGVGPVEIGASVATVQVTTSAALSYENDPATCPERVGVFTTNGMGTILASLDHATYETVEAVTLTSLWGSEATVPGPRTLEGIGLGSSEAALQAVPGIELTEQNDMHTVYRQSAQRPIVFEISAGVVVTIFVSDDGVLPVEYCG